MVVSGWCDGKVDAINRLRAGGRKVAFVGDCVAFVVAETREQARNAAEMIDVVNRYHGQGVLNLNLVTLDGLKGELDASVLELFPAQMGETTGPVERRAAND